MLEGNPALMNLRVLQSLASVQNAGNTLVLGMPAGFVPLKNGKSGSATKRHDHGRNVITAGGCESARPHPPMATPFHFRRKKAD